MIADLVGRICLPQMTLSDEIFGRLYYVVSSCVDTIQTVAKVVRSIFAGALAFVFFGQSSLLNKASLLSWDDVAFSFQMTIYSILGILSPRLAWVKKCDSHIGNLTSSRRVNFSDFLLEQWGPQKLTGLKIFLVSQMLESGIRCFSSYIRFGCAEGLVALSLDNAKFVKLLSEGAYRSAELASHEINLISRTIFS